MRSLCIPRSSGMLSSNREGWISRRSAGRLPSTTPASYRMTWHWPMCPGRSSEPMGFHPKETVYSGEHTHCCGGAYGAKIGDHRLKDAVTSMRMKELQGTGADIFVTACPTCKSVLSEMNMKYITELVAEMIVAE